MPLTIGTAWAYGMPLKPGARNTWLSGVPDRYSMVRYTIEPSRSKS